MGLNYDTALVTGAELVTYTSQTDLANLTTDSELNLDNFVLDAHREVYERLYASGLSEEQLAALDNAAWLKRHVAALALARIEEVHLDRPDVAERRRAEALRQVDRFRPIISTLSGALPRRAGEPIPAIRHASGGHVYGLPADSNLPTDYTRSNLPTNLG